MWSSFVYCRYSLFEQEYSKRTLSMFSRDDFTIFTVLLQSYRNSKMQNTKKLSRPLILFIIYSFFADVADEKVQIKFLMNSFSRVSRLVFYLNKVSCRFAVVLVALYVLVTMFYQRFSNVLHWR